jgi:hypothetical protein
MRSLGAARPQPVAGWIVLAKPRRYQRAMKKKLTYGLALLATCGVAASLLTPAPAAEDLDPLKVAGDTHTLVFENSFVRVIQAKVPAGKLEAKHSHPHGLTVYLADYSIEQKTFPEGKLTKHDRKFGQVVWGEAVTHEVKNISNNTSHAIRIELKH